VNNEEVLHRAKEKTDIIQTIKRRKANCIGHILHRNCFVKHTTEGKIKGMLNMRERQGRRCSELLYELKEKRGYWKLKEVILVHTLWRTSFGRGYGPVVRQTTK
jgi:hypothetical protein